MSDSTLSPPDPRAEGSTLRLSPGDVPDATLTAALVAARGWPVLALQPGSKRPFHAGGGAPNHGDFWLTDARQVLAAYENAIDWTTRRVGCQFASMTGVAPSGGFALVALDQDGDPDELAALLAQAGPAGEAWAAATLKVQRVPGRAHLWGLLPPDECPTTGRLGPGLEWRGRGGYVLLPGARHPEGQRYEITGGRVELSAGEMPQAPAIFRGVVGPDSAGEPAVAWAHVLPVPTALLAVIRARLGERSTQRRALPSTVPGPELLGAGVGALTPSVARGRLAGALRWLEAATPDRDRNTRLNGAAGVVAGILARVPAGDRVGDVDPAVWRARLRGAAIALGLPASEVDTTLRSAWAYGTAHPEQAAPDRPEPGVARAGVTGGSSSGSRLVVTRASDIAMRVVEWAWQTAERHGRLPRGELAIVAGKAGRGKSTRVHALAAQITRGTLPGCFYGTPRSVIISATEESWETTIKAKLTACGADHDRVLRVESLAEETPEGHLVTKGLDLRTGVGELEQLMMAEDVGMLILDPLISRLGKLDTHKDAEVRVALDPLVAALHRTQAVGIGILHFNKSDTSDPLDLLMGSTAFGAVARSVHVVDADPDSPGDLLLATIKANLGRTDASGLPMLRFRLHEVAVEVPGGAQTYVAMAVDLGEDTSGRTYADVQRQARALARSHARIASGVRTAADEACEFLADWMRTHHYSASSAEVKQAAADREIALATLAKARLALGVNVGARDGFGGPTTWFWPPDSEKKWADRRRPDSRLA